MVRWTFPLSRGRQVLVSKASKNWGEYKMPMARGTGNERGGGG